MEAPPSGLLWLRIRAGHLFFENVAHDSMIEDVYETDQQTLTSSASSRINWSQSNFKEIQAYLSLDVFPYARRVET
jgi:hypothetical protein